MTKRKVLKKDFFEQKTLIVAEQLIGKFLVRKGSAYMITETEAYDGFHDKASHASRGMTPRNKVMFGSAGVWYVYFVYGMHHMLNVVTGPEEYPAAVLIRAVEGIKGPARLTKKLEVDKSINEQTLSQKTGLWIEDRGIAVAKRQIQKTPRIGVVYAGPIWAGKNWRFVLKDDDCKKK